MKARIFLRLFVEVCSKKLALEVAQSIVDIVKEFAPIERRTIEKYWKIEKYYEILLEINSDNNEKQDCLNVVNALGHGWEELNECEYVWNPHVGANLVFKELKWAHLECVNA